MLHLHKARLLLQLENLLLLLLLLLNCVHGCSRCLGLLAGNHLQKSRSNASHGGRCWLLQDNDLGLLLQRLLLPHGRRLDYDRLENTLLLQGLLRGLLRGLLHDLDRLLLHHLLLYLGKAIVGCCHSRQSSQSLGARR